MGESRERMIENGRLDENNMWREIKMEKRSSGVLGMEKMVLKKECRIVKKLEREIEVGNKKREIDENKIKWNKRKKDWSFDVRRNIKESKE